MTIVKVIAPASDCLVELAYDNINRYRIHIPPGIALDFLLDGLHCFV